MKTTFLYYLKTRRYYWYTPGVSMLASCSLWDLLAPHDQKGLNLEMLDQYLTDEGMDMTLSPELAKLAEPGIDLDAELVTILGQHPTQELQQDLELDLGAIDLAPFLKNTESDQAKVPKGKSTLQIVKKYNNMSLSEVKLKKINPALAQEKIPTLQSRAPIGDLLNDHNTYSKRFTIRFKELARKKEIVSQYANETPSTRLEKANQALAKEGIPIFKHKEALCCFMLRHKIQFNYSVIRATELARKKEIVNQYANDKTDTRLEKVNQALAKEGIPIFKHKEALCHFIGYHNHSYKHYKDKELAQKKEIVSQYANDKTDTRLEKVNQALAKEGIPTFKHKEALCHFICYHNLSLKCYKEKELAKKKEIVNQYANDTTDTRLEKVNQALAKEGITTFKHKEALCHFIGYHNHSYKRYKDKKIARKKEIISQYANEIPSTRLEKINQALAKEAIPVFKHKEALRYFILRHKIQINYLFVRFKELARRKEIVSQYANEIPSTRLEKVNQALAKEGIPIFKHKEALCCFMLRHKIQLNNFFIRATEIKRKKEIISQYANEIPNTRLAQVNQALAKEGIPTFKHKEALRCFIFRHKIQINNFFIRATEPRKKAIINQYANPYLNTRPETFNPTVAGIPTGEREPSDLINDLNPYSNTLDRRREVTSTNPYPNTRPETFNPTVAGIPTGEREPSDLINDLNPYSNTLDRRFDLINDLNPYSNTLDRRREVTSTNPYPNTRPETFNPTVAGIPTGEREPFDLINDLNPYSNTLDRREVTSTNPYPNTRPETFNPTVAGIPTGEREPFDLINDLNPRFKNLFIRYKELAKKKAIVSQYTNEPLDTRLAQVNQALAKEGIPTFKNNATLRHFICYHNPRPKSSTELKRKKEIVSQYINELPDTRLAKINQALAKEGIPTFKHKAALRHFIGYHNHSPNHIFIRYTELERKKAITSQYANSKASTRLAQINQVLTQEGICTFKNKEALSYFIFFHKIKPNTRTKKKEIVNAYVNEDPDTRLAKINQALTKEKIPSFKNNAALHYFMSHNKIQYNQFVIRTTELKRKKAIVNQYVNEGTSTRLAKINQALAKEAIPMFENKTMLNAFISYHNIHFYEQARKREIVSLYINEQSDTRLTQVNQALAQERIPTFENKATLSAFINDQHIQPNLLAQKREISQPTYERAI